MSRNTSPRDLKASSYGLAVVVDFSSENSAS